MVDPLADQMRIWAPYFYGANNPIRYIDVDGMYYNDYYMSEQGQLLYVVRTDEGSDNFYQVKGEGNNLSVNFYINVDHSEKVWEDGEVIERANAFSRLDDHEKVTLVYRAGTFAKEHCPHWKVTERIFEYTKTAIDLIIHNRGSNKDPNRIIGGFIHWPKRLIRFSDLIGPMRSGKEVEVEPGILPKPSKGQILPFPSRAPLKNETPNKYPLLKERSPEIPISKNSGIINRESKFIGDYGSDKPDWLYKNFQYEEKL